MSSQFSVKNDSYSGAKVLVLPESSHLHPTYPVASQHQDRQAHTQLARKWHNL